MLHIIRSMTPRIFEWSNHTLSETLCKKIIEANNDGLSDVIGSFVLVTSIFTYIYHILSEPSFQ